MCGRAGVLDCTWLPRPIILVLGIFIFVAFDQDYEWLEKQWGIDVWILKQRYIEPDTTFGRAIQLKLDEATNPTARRWWKTIYQHSLGLAKEMGNDLALAYMHSIQKYLMWQSQYFFSADAIDCDSLCYFSERTRDRVYAIMDPNVWHKKN